MSLSHLALSRAKRRPVLAPLALAYAAAGFLHRRFVLRPTLRERGHLLPLIVIGALRAGGSGKTAVTLELSRFLAAQGRRVGVLAYQLRKPAFAHAGTLAGAADGVMEIFPDTDWRLCSDEAVLLARASNGRVFVTRNRERAWDALSRLGSFDVLISDDGLMDPRLTGAFRIALHSPHETPGLLDLLPAGPYRLTKAALKRVDLEAQGPLPPPAFAARENLGATFQRSLVFPDGFDKGKTWWAVCGLGNPEAFEQDLRCAGVCLAGMLVGPDHGLPTMQVLRQAAKLRPDAGFLCTRKDAIKWQVWREEMGDAAVIGERIELSEGLLSSLSEYLKKFPSW